MSKSLIIDELHRNARKNYSRRKTQMRGIYDTLQIDLAEMGMHAKENRNYRYILVAIDIFSKFIWAAAIKSKTATEVTQAMSKILSKLPSIKNIQSDAGTEFFNSHFKNLMQRMKINHYTSFSKTKASICERAIRTLKTKIYKRFHLRGNYKWFDVLSDIVNEYNNSKHRTIRMKPNEVNKENEKHLLRGVYKHTSLLTTNKFKMGDHVRISKYKSVFAKGYLPNWTTEIFTIRKIQDTQPFTYLLRDYQGNDVVGAFYDVELQKVQSPNIYLIEKVLRTKGDKIFVKWLGFDASHNSWVNKNDVSIN